MTLEKFASCTRSLTAAGLFVLSGTVQAFTIQFDYTYDDNGFFSVNSGASTLLESAGSYFESRIGDDLNAITSTPGPGGNNFRAIFDRPDTGSEVTLSRFSVPADTIIVYVGGRNISALGEGGPGGYSVSSSPADQAFIDNVSGRGEAGETQGASAVDFAPWGGSITFDSNSNWYIDDNLAVDESFSGFDFYSVALHEIAHVLGFGTSDSWNSNINGSFTGSNASALFGGPVPLADAGHWQQALTSTIDGSGSQEVAMDPNIAAGQRKPFTDLDLAGLADVGWQISAVPLPAAAYLFGAGMLALIGFGKRRYSS